MWFNFGLVEEDVRIAERYHLYNIYICICSLFKIRSCLVEKDSVLTGSSHLGYEFAGLRYIIVYGETRKPSLRDQILDHVF